MVIYASALARRLHAIDRVISTAGVSQCRVQRQTLPPHCPSHRPSGCKALHRRKKPTPRHSQPCWTLPRRSATQILRLHRKPPPQRFRRRPVPHGRRVGTAGDRPTRARTIRVLRQPPQRIRIRRQRQATTRHHRTAAALTRTPSVPTMTDRLRSGLIPSRTPQWMRLLGN